MTISGSVKDKTDCSPSNGYYFLPIYDKGEYVLKITPPPGWSFEPEEVAINFNGKDLCSQGKDINFMFKGFGITGRVNVAGQKAGANGVNVELTPREQVNGVQRKTVTDLNGVFSFSPIIPGSYVIKVSHDKWHFEKDEHEVLVQVGNTELPSNLLTVTGFDVKAKVQSDGQPFGNMGILLYAKTNNARLKCSGGSLPNIASGNSDYQSSPVCLRKSCPETGSVTFEGLAPGKYLVKPTMDNSALRYNIEPNEVEFEVVKDTLDIGKVFEVTGFSISGKVLAGINGKGVPKATIKLNGKQVASTRTDGSYTLDNIKASTYTIQVSVENMQFPDHTVKISAANPVIPDIVVSAFKVCGTVMNQNSHKVAITKHSSTFHTEVDTQAGSGEWCTFLPSGRYSVEVLTTGEEIRKGIQFFPIKQTIDVDSTPMSSISFSQLKATVSGDLKCRSDSKDHCNNVKINLNSLDSSGQIYTAELKAGKYQFSEILPGKYEVVAQNPVLCWEQTKIPIEVKSAEEMVPSFVHTGYKITVISSHSASMSYWLRIQEPEKPSVQTVELKNGLNDFCVSSAAGTYDLKFTSCHSNEDERSVLSSFSTGSLSPFTVTFNRHRHGLAVLVDEKDKFVMQVVRGNSKSVINMKEQANKVNGMFSYRYEFDLKSQESVKLIPSSETLLFEPLTSELVGSNDCVDTAFTFTAKKGLIINGRVEPAIQDIKVKMTLKSGESLTQMTDKNGGFKFGPIDSSLEYTLTAEKESYVFSEYDSKRNVFNAHKLCEIVVTVKDEAGKRLNGVLLSLSGGESYRKNLITGSDGSINFHSLSPSQYFLKPMMKEYKFEPNSKMIEIADGETVNLELVGKRIAYSAFGQVTSLNGEPFANVILEAVSEECSHHQEESNSESNGVYRIRGLQPGCSYSVRVKRDDPTNNIVDRTIPAERQIKIESTDVRDVNIIAISPIGFVDVAARILTTNNDHYKTLRIAMFKKGNSDNPIYSQRVESPLNVKSKFNPGIMVFFPRIPFNGKTYVIELTTSLSEKNFKLEPQVYQFQANRSVFHEFFFSPEIRLADAEMNQNSIAALLLIGIVAFAFLKQETFFELVKMIFNRVSDFIMDLIEKSKRKEATKYETVLNDRDLDSLAKSINDVRKKKVRKM